MNEPLHALKRKIVAILAADIAEYTRMTAEDEEETIARLESYRRVFDDFVRRSGGRIFNTGGDSVMCEFNSAVEATRCAIDIQESFRTRNLAYPPHRQMHFRIGISIGDVLEREGDLLGDSVNIAARLQTLAEPGSICVSRNVQEMVTNKISVPLLDLGFREVKNLPYPVHAFLVDIGGLKPKVMAQPALKPLADAGASRPMLRLASRWIAAGLAVAIVGLGVRWLWRADVSDTPSSDSAPMQTQAQQEPLARPGSGSVVVVENLTPAQAFERLAKSGGLVQNPSTPVELYHNARLFEGRGDSANARRDYLSLAAHGGNYIDPLLRLAALIRAQDGRAGARDVFGDLARNGSLAAALTHALQFEGVERTKRLAAFADANPDFPPAQYLLAVELGDDRQNAQTIDEKRRELIALSRFLAFERDGKLVPFFLDQSVLAQWIGRAQQREAAAKAFFAEGRDQISAEFMRTNSGWMSAVVLPEPAIQLEYRAEPNGEFRSTGFLGTLDPRTGKPMPAPSFELPPQLAAQGIAMRYTDTKGVASPVSMVTFDPRSALHRGMRENLQRFSHSWVSFGAGQNSSRAYLTALMNYRCGIQKVELGFNGDPPQETFMLPPCDPSNPFLVPANARASIDLSPDAQSVTVRLTFVGGETSEIRTFPRPAR